jgi:glycosyltransferase involved in cell wall biosynthesis
MKELTLVIPAKDEVECLPRVLDELKNFDCKKIIIIPEADLNTRNSIKNFDCKIITQKTGGFGSALILGIKEVETNFLCIFNADGSFDPQYLKNMYNELLNNRDFVFNSRYENSGGSDDDTFLTLVGNKIFTFICNLLFRLNISDVLFTYVMGKTLAFKSLNLKRKDFRICIELPVLAKFKKYKFISKPSYERSRLSGRKKVNELKDGFLILLCILELFIFRK